MSEFKILWIDDFWDKKVDPDGFNYLNAVRKAITDRNDRITIDAKSTIASGIVAFFVNNKNLNYDLLIVDIRYLNAEGENINLIYETASKKSIPVIIFSSYVDEIYNKVPEFADSPILLGLYQKKNKSQFIDAVAEAARFKTFNIVHISDFHFDSSLEDPHRLEQAERFANLADTLRKENLEKRIDLIIFSGDFAYKNPKEDLLQCFEIIQKIVLQTTNDFSKLLIVPGNHDIEWSDFKNKILSATPGFWFYDFLKKIYITDYEFIFSLIGFNKNNGEFDKHYDPDSFCWSRSFENLNLEVIGINTVTTQPDILGLGKVSNSVLKFIRKTWELPPQGQNLRIAILHHNILPPFSINTLNESKNILNAGEVLDTLAGCGCNIIFSGHCHDSYLYNFSYSFLNHKGFSEMRNISYLSTGTTGGYTGTLDKARSLSILSVIPSKEFKTRHAIVTPMLYDSNLRSWIGCKPLNTIISK